MQPAGQAPAVITRRRLILRDSLTFLSLSLITIALFSVTLLLFRSFASHRTELGKRWSARGAASLAHGRPAEAIDSLRTALSYTPGERSYELLLAQALAEAGHTDEAFTYFSGLWDTQPGNGFINLQLARLAARRRDPKQAVNFYRASIYGTWEGDGAVRRRDVRLELAEYLLQHNEVPAARAELLVAEGNADEDPALDLRLGKLFEGAGDRSDALEAYLKATEAEPKNPTALVSAGQLAYTMGQFSLAKRLLQQALRETDKLESRSAIDRPAVSSLFEKSDRILDLLPSRKLPSEQRVSRLLDLKDIARRRLDTCPSDPSTPNPQVEDLRTRWKEQTKSDTRAALKHDPARQDVLLQLVFDTELKTEKLCGPVTGDDTLLLTLAHDPGSVDQ